ncbi:hypothetical protein QWJ26_26595 [Streptomyces sp. CSDS2]|uniref:hypothetical protein n=1 Tax=Streptomyces sp. CSDS2 TaxID=3055051 RepID=UPI0025B25891|nr:hypothetical protein [Streptomyces sp. CSDS2]MDN3263315.1 hypothetical protein [Streptomyces sp. CSDS2]
MADAQQRTPAPTELQPATKVESIKDGMGAKKSSPALMEPRDWIDLQVSRAPKLSAERWRRVAAILGGK